MLNLLFFFSLLSQLLERASQTDLRIPDLGAKEKTKTGGAQAFGHLKERASSMNEKKGLAGWLWFQLTGPFSQKVQKSKMGYGVVLKMNRLFCYRLTERTLVL